MFDEVWQSRLGVFEFAETRRNGDACNAWVAVVEDKAPSTSKVGLGLGQARQYNMSAPFVYLLTGEV